MKLVKRAILLYDGVREYRADIFEHDVWYGTGDDEDPPEIADDREMICYPIGYQDLTNSERYTGIGNGFATLEEAVQHLEELAYFLRWADIPESEMGKAPPQDW